MGEEFLTIQSMKQNAKGIDIFQEFNGTHIDFSLPVEGLVGIAIDGAPSMLGRITGFKGNVMNWFESINPPIFRGALFDTSSSSVCKKGCL